MQDWLPTQSNLRRVLVVALALFALSAALQLLLAAGVVPITWAWGGAQETLTPSIRVASIAAALVLIAFASVIWARTRPGASRIVRAGAWGIVAFLAVNTAGNLASSSNEERLLFAPLALLLTLTSAYIARSR